MKDEKWRVARASAAGLVHIRQNTACQDRFLTATIETASDGKVLIAAVADGAGSAQRGAEGAELACRTFVEQITTFLSAPDAGVGSLNEDFGKRWVEFFRNEISDVARNAEKSRRDYASTLLAAVVGESCAAFYQIGDGGIVVSMDGKPGSYRFAVAPGDAEYVNMTDFLTDETAAEQIKFNCLNEKLEDVILFSDGIFAVAVDYQTNQPHEPFLIPMIAPLRKMTAQGEANNGDSSDIQSLNQKLENFLSSPKLNERTDDDKTIVLASRAQVAGEISVEAAAETT